MNDPEALREARRAAERAGDDEALLRWRALERAHEALPPTVDGARRTHLIDADPIATTWLAWDLRGGHPLILRTLRPEWRRDPVMLRRMARASTLNLIDGLVRPDWYPDGDWPHLRVAPQGTALVDLQGAHDDQPAELGPLAMDPAALARALVRLLGVIEHLHQHGRGPGQRLASSLWIQRDEIQLCWLDRFPSRPGVAQDLTELGDVISLLGAGSNHPFLALAAGWSTAPPPSLQDARHLTLQALATELAHARHRLAFSARNRGRNARLIRLRRLVDRLATAMPPPTGRAVLYAAPDGVRIAISSEQGRVMGGATTSADPRALPVLWAPDQPVDVAAARVVLRAWSTHARGDPELRARLQAEWGGSDARAGDILRWLRAMLRLRSARLLLQAEAG